MEENQLQQSVGYSQISMEYPEPNTALYTLPKIMKIYGWELIWMKKTTQYVKGYKILPSHSLDFHPNLNLQRRRDICLQPTSSNWKLQLIYFWFCSHCYFSKEFSVWKQNQQSWSVMSEKLVGEKIQAAFVHLYPQSRCLHQSLD